MKNTLTYLLLFLVFVMYFAMLLATATFIPVTLTFLILKLCNVVAWNWFLVLGLPLIIGAVSSFVVIFTKISLEK